MRIYFINLGRRTDRRAAMEAQFQRLGLDATPIAAVTPDELTIEQKARSCNPSRHFWMTELELCCGLSHLRALEKFLADGGPHAVILEDDAVLSPSLPRFLTAFSASPHDTALLRLETDLYGQRLVPHPEAVIGDIEVRQSWSWAAGSAAYLVSRAGAEAILESPSMHQVQADRALFNPYERLGRKLKMKHVWPALAIQADRLDPQRMDSDIAAARTSHGSEGHQGFLARTWRLIRGIYEIELVIGTQRLFHILAHKARKQTVPFKAD